MSTHIISNYGRLSKVKQRQIVADIFQLLVRISSLSLFLLLILSCCILFAFLLQSLKESELHLLKVYSKDCIKLPHCEFYE